MTCTARWATGNGAHQAGDLCGQPATETIGDIDLCPHHFRRALDWFYKRRIELPKEHQREHEESLRQAAEARRLAAEARSIVYYLHRPADGLIKIGTSIDHKSRFSDLRREHGPLRLLLAYPGTRAEETEAHGRFAALRVEGEWFRPELPLLKAVLRMRGFAPKGRTRLPAQVPVAEIRALVKAARERRGPVTATLTATGNMDSGGQEPTCMPLPGFFALESGPVHRRPGLHVRRHRESSPADRAGPALPAEYRDDQSKVRPAAVIGTDRRADGQQRLRMN